MNKIYKPFVFIGKILSILYPLKIHTKFTVARGFLNAAYRRSSFKSCGKDCYIQPGVRFNNPQHISIGDNFCVQSGTLISAVAEYEGHLYYPSLKIGDRVNIGRGNHFTAIDSITIGNDVLMGSFITITDHSHGFTKGNDLKLPPMSRPLMSKGKVVIGDRVWIGDRVTILPNVEIGDGAVIGANSVVTQNIPAGATAIGIPARFSIPK